MTSRRAPWVGPAVRFSVVACTCGAVDLATYQVLAAVWGVWTPLARTVSFALGTALAYLGHRRWAFRAAGGAGRAARFAALYAVMFFVVLTGHTVALAALPPARWAGPAAWALSQTLASATNFIVLRWRIFPPRPSPTP